MDYHKSELRAGQLTGWVYVLRHSCMPGLLKIGFTNRTVGVRKAELEAPTGVPGPFILIRQMPVYRIEVEREVHRRLKRWREVGNREFFRCSVWRARWVIWAANRDYGRETGQGGWSLMALLAPGPRQRRPAARTRVGQGRRRRAVWNRPERLIMAAAVCLALVVAVMQPSLAWVPDGAVKRVAVWVETTAQD